MELVCCSFSMILHLFRVKQSVYGMRYRYECLNLRQRIEDAQGLNPLSQ
jgi:hypothetical protein